MYITDFLFHIYLGLAQACPKLHIDTSYHQSVMVTGNKSAVQQTLTAMILYASISQNGLATYIIQLIVHYMYPYIVGDPSTKALLY